MGFSNDVELCICSKYIFNFLRRFAGFHLQKLLAKHLSVSILPPDRIQLYFPTHRLKVHELFRTLLNSLFYAFSIVHYNIRCAYIFFSDRIHFDL